MIYSFEGRIKRPSVPRTIALQKLGDGTWLGLFERILGDYPNMETADIALDGYCELQAAARYEDATFARIVRERCKNEVCRIRLDFGHRSGDVLDDVEPKVLSWAHCSSTDELKQRAAEACDLLGHFECEKYPGFNSVTPVHGDLHWNNILIDRARNPIFLDWDDSYLGIVGMGYDELLLERPVSNLSTQLRRLEAEFSRNLGSPTGAIAHCVALGAIVRMAQLRIKLIELGRPRQRHQLYAIAWLSRLRDILEYTHRGDVRTDPESTVDR
ncbi:phosphotransferase [Nocardia sp. NPDC051321]|uniref:phosphotransferase n=1 Tax=Nocardia sp. NPDC051321 TaxID=3364323 RepID=UPI00378ADD7A